MVTSNRAELNRRTVRDATPVSQPEPEQVEEFARRWLRRAIASTDDELGGEPPGLGRELRSDWVALNSVMAYQAALNGGEFTASAADLVRLAGLPAERAPRALLALDYQESMGWSSISNVPPHQQLRTYRLRLPPGGTDPCPLA